MSVTLIKAQRILQRHGVKALIGRGFSEGTNFIRALRFLKGQPRFQSVDALLDGASSACGGIIASFQVRSEIKQLLELLRGRTIKTVLEIGTANGGTLFLFTRVAAPDATLISVDLPGGEFGEGYARWRTPLYRSFAIDRQAIHLFRADSHAPDTVATVREMLGGRSVDFLFIDGDHTYEGVKRDFEMYSPLVGSGGVIALHDIALHPPSSGCEVERFWRELRSQYRVREFINNPQQGWAGIGVVEVP
jgi:predicted O-methyltransferase YrrM